MQNTKHVTLGSDRSDLRIVIDAPGAALSLSGPLAARTVADVRQALMAALAGGTGDLIVDIGQVVLVDASGLGVLVGAHRLALRGERRLVLRNTPERIERLLAVTHLNRVLTCEPAADRITVAVGA